MSRLATDMKTCRDCKKEKEQNLFIRNGGFKSGYDTLCLLCNRKRVKAWRKKNPEKRAVQSKREGQKEYSRSKQYRVYYGITLDDYNKMFAAQNGCCAICKTHQTHFKRRLSVDHNHTSQQIRQLLCHNCNALLGHAKENVNVLETAISYLTKHANQTGY